jgi:hypothetical protein
MNTATYTRRFLSVVANLGGGNPAFPAGDFFGRGAIFQAPSRTVVEFRGDHIEVLGRDLSDVRSFG